MEKPVAAVKPLALTFFFFFNKFVPTSCSLLVSVALALADSIN